VTQLQAMERERLNKPVTPEQLREIFPPHVLKSKYDLDSDIFILDAGRLFYYFGVLNEWQVQLLATSAYNIFDTESKR
jgi:hypothetical protein